MKQLTMFFLVVLLLTCWTLFASDSKEEQKPSFSIGILSYIHYVYDLSQDADYNGFEITRNYIDIKYNYNDNIRFRLTPDFFRQGNGPLTGIIKYAYVEFKEPFGITDTYVRIGMNPTAWEGYMNDWWGFRWINKTPSGTWKISKSADLGITLLGSLLDKLVSYQVSFSNGEGYSAGPEQDSAKSFEATLELFPVKEIPIHLFGHIRRGQLTSEDESDNNLYAGAVYYKTEMLRLGVEYMESKINDVSSTLLSLIGSLEISDIIVMARYDSFDPVDVEEGDEQSLMIAGAGYRLSKNVQAMIDIKMKHYKDGILPDETEAYCHWEIKF